MEDLGNKNAVPVDKLEYERIRMEAIRKVGPSQSFAEGHRPS
jgi:hypothetical protein